MKRQEVHIRDPYVLEDNGKYYLYGSTDEHIWGGECSTFSVYVTEDLENFEGPYVVFDRPEGFWSKEHYWAPEVHKYNGKYYMFASFHTEEDGRRSQILVSDSPLGQFKLFSKPFTPKGWDCLDATLYVEDGVPYSVFCHEWAQIKDGTMELVKLKKDLSGVDGEPVTLFSASSAPWVGVTSYIGKFDGYITDGPFLYKLKSGKLLLIWSSTVNRTTYAVGMAVSDNGKINGPWRHIEKPLYDKDGGHANIFKKDGELYLSLHAPNSWPNERPQFIKLEELEDQVKIV